MSLTAPSFRPTRPPYFEGTHKAALRSVGAETKGLSTRRRNLPMPTLTLSARTFSPSEGG